MIEGNRVHKVEQVSGGDGGRGEGGKERRREGNTEGGREGENKQIDLKLNTDRFEVLREMVVATLRNSIWVVSYVSAIKLLHSK